MINQILDTHSAEYMKPFKNPSGLFFVGGWLFSSLKTSYLFNSQIGTSLILSNDLVEYLNKKNIPNNLEIKLAQRGFMTLDNAKTLILDDVKTRNTERIINPTFFLIDLTKSCNCRCVYCFRDLNQTESITSDRLDDILIYIVNYCNKKKLKKITIQPWGGEPLIKWNEIKKIQEFIRSNNIEATILVETNALLLTKEIAQEAFQRQINISVSIDGFEKIHNSHRKLCNGKDSFKTVIKNLHYLRDAGYGNNFGVVCVLTSESLQYIEDIIDFLALELKIPRVKINMVKDNPIMKLKKLCIKNEEIPYLQRKLLDKIIEVNSMEVSFGESNIVDRLHNLLSRKTLNFCNSRGCQAGKRMLSFGLDGGIYPCDLTDNKRLMLGTIYDDRELTSILQENAKKLHPFFLDKEGESCVTCLWSIFCKGGCTTAILNNEKKQLVDIADCTRNRTLYPLLIDLILSKPHLLKSITGNEIEII